MSVVRCVERILLSIILSVGGYVEYFELFHTVVTYRRRALTNEFRFGAIIPFGEQLCLSCVSTQTATSEMCLKASDNILTRQKNCATLPFDREISIASTA